jgi:DNA-binding XRE family transcriptional regulator
MSSAPVDDVVSDVVVLAAIDRAERHSGRATRGVPVWAVLEHLDLANRSKRARHVRARLDALETMGSLERSHRHGVPVWVLTSSARRRLSRARRVGRVPELPESPQHRVWREARALAEQRIVAFWMELLDRVEHAHELLDAPTPGPPVLDAPDTVPGPASDAWLEVGEQLQRACRRLASASYCLWEWREPEDARVDVDDFSGPCDRALDPDQRAEQREQQDITVAELAGKAGIGKRRLQRLEAGKLDPDYKLWAALASALNLKTSVLALRAGALEVTDGPP